MPAAVDTQTILIIEDDEAIRDVVHFALENEGFDVHSAETRSAALEQCADLCPDLVLMDLFMPGLGPVEFLNYLHTKCPGCKVILMTAAVNARHEARRLGLEYCIAKPFDLDGLMNTIQQCRD